jgi:hypothetical protein
MSVYVKVDGQGNVLEFPYRIRDIRNIPEDAVKCDTVSQKPKVKWYQGLWYDRVEKDGDNYVVYYTIGLKKYSSEQEKKQVLTTLIAQSTIDSQRSLNSGRITQEQYDNNMSILASVDLNDESTYDNYDNLIL